MQTVEIVETGQGQAVPLPEEFRFATTTVSIRREGDAVILEPIKSAQWPKGFFDAIHIVVLCIVVAILGRFLPPRGPAYVLTSDAARGVVRLRFRNPEYARVLAKCLGGLDSAELASKQSRVRSNAFTTGPPPAQLS